MTLDNTPITILEKEIKFLKDFIRILDTREGLDPDAPQEKLNNLRDQCAAKIDEFEIAIGKLKSVVPQWKKAFESTIGFERNRELLRDNHMINVSVRKDGQWHELEADWMKHLIQENYPKQ
jgi:hypothetical protein